MSEASGFDKPNGPNNGGNEASGHRPGYTGRYLVTFAAGTADKGAALLRDKAGVQAFSARDPGKEIPGKDSMVFEEIGVAVVSAHPDQHRALMAAVADTNVPVSYLEPERVVYATMLPTGFRRRISSLPPPATGNVIESPSAYPSMSLPPIGIASGGLNADFLRGYAAAIEGLIAATEGGGYAHAAMSHDVVAEASTLTWGLTTTRVAQSALSGRGIKVAILDTGMDLHHPDFAGRTIVSRSFVSGEVVQDGHGHGTHCVGVSCGPQKPSIGPRYGVAYGADIYVGKVLSNEGSGVDGDILAGINWAVANRCGIVSMSLGAPVEPGESYSKTYQNAAQVAESKGTLIVAAAGNESDRPYSIAPVGHPANCPTIIAVAALDSSLRVAYFSCGGNNGDGGEVNIAAPGVDVYSSWPMPQRYNTISGTSMATPCMAGICALYAESTGLKGISLANYVLKQARRMNPIRDFGWGLVHAR